MKVGSYIISFTKDNILIINKLILKIWLVGFCKSWSHSISFIFAPREINATEKKKAVLLCDSLLKVWGLIQREMNNKPGNANIFTMLKWLSCTFYKAYAKEKCWQVLCWNISLVKGFIMNHLSFTLPSLVLPAILCLPKWERDSCQRDGFLSVIFLFVSVLLSHLWDFFPPYKMQHVG